MKRVYIHIGLHKTGSTYIQKVFAENRDALRDSGIDYPMLGAEFLFGHHNLAWSFIPRRSLENTDSFTLEKFSTYLNQNRTKCTVLSSEDFEFFQPKQISALHSLLASHDARIIMYLRNPIKALYSRWQESIKHGDTISLPNYCQQILAEPQPLDYCRIANNWAAIFGQEAMNIVIYDNLVESKTDIAIYFLKELLGIVLPAEKLILPPGRVNPSSEFGVIEVLRQLNLIQSSLEKSEKLTIPFMQFVCSQPRGQELVQYLQQLSDEKDEIEEIDLAPLQVVFSKVAERFLSIHQSQITNLYSDGQLFKSKWPKEPNISLLKAEIIQKKIAIEQLYRFLT